MPEKISKRQLQSRETEALLQKTAIDLINSYGYNNITVSRICREAGVSKGTFYLYFKSKSDIINHILSNLNKSMFMEKQWEQESDPSERLLSFTQFYLSIVTQKGPEFAREVLKIIIDENPEPGAVNSDLHKDNISGILTWGIEVGAFRKDLSIHDETKTIQSIFFGLILTWAADDGRFNILESGVSSIKTLLTAYRSH